MVRSLAALWIALLLALAGSAPALAHANLVRSEPPIGATLDAAPAAIVLEFSEALDPAFSRIQLINGRGQAVEAGPATVDPASPQVLRLALDALPDDSYTALWRVRSSVDGHITEGSLPFGVGVPPAAGGLIPPLGTPEPATAPPPAIDSLLRWWSYLAAALAFGALPFGLLVWRPALIATRSLGGGAGDAATQMAGQLRRLVVAGGLLLIMATVLFMLRQAGQAAGVGPAEALGTPLRDLLAAYGGQLLLARVALAAAVVAIGARLPAPDSARPWQWWLALALAGGALLTFSLLGHSAATRDGAPLAVALIWLHMAAMVAWLGGLVPLLLALGMARRAPDHGPAPGMLLPHFSRMGIVCIAVLVLSGAVSALAEVGRPELLLDTTYGRALLAKLGLFGVLLLLGAINRLGLMPRMRRAGDQVAGALRRNVRVELLAGAALLLAVGVMTSVAPSRVAWEQQQRLGAREAARVDDVDLVLRIAPAKIGSNEFAVDIADRRPGASQAPARVLLRFGMIGMEMGELQTDTTTNDNIRYVARGNYLSMGGRWQIEVILRREGFDDIRHTFEIDVLEPALVARSWSIAEITRQQ